MMLVSSEKELSSRLRLPEESLRLLSINQARKILRIRFDAVKRLVKGGKIKSVEINGKTKISFMHLIEFVNQQDEILTKNPPDDGIITSEETQNKIDSIIKNYSGR